MNRETAIANADCLRRGKTVFQPAGIIRDFPSIALAKRDTRGRKCVALQAGETLPVRFQKVPA